MKKNRDNQLIKTATIPLASVVVGFLVAAALSIFIVQSGTRADHQQQIMNLAADNVQHRINQIQNQISSQARSMATSIRLTELVSNGDAAERSLEEARLRELIPGAIRVRLFKKGEAKIDREANPPFTFTSKNLANRVEAGENVFPEAINADGRWIISLAAPITPPSEDSIHGSLFIYLDVTAITDRLSEGVDGKVKLIQSFRNTPETEFLSIGSGRENLEFSRDLANINWKLKYNPGGNIPAESPGNLVTFILPAIAAFVLALIGVLVGAQKSVSNLRKDTATLHAQMTEVLNNNYQKVQSYNHTEFLELDEVLSTMGRKVAEPTPAESPSAEVAPTAGESDEMVDIEMVDEQGTGDHSEDAEPEEPEVQVVDVSGIFRAYDIRGVVGHTLTPTIVTRIGKAIGTEADEIGDQTLVVAADGRLSSPEILDALITGLTESGRDVVNLGFVPTPLLYYAIHNSEAQSGVMVTGSHNPADQNGLKIVLGGRTLVDDDIQSLYQRYLSEDFSSGDGQVTEIDIREDYLESIIDDVVVAQPLKVVVDCGNGIAGQIAPDLLVNLGCEVIPLYCEVDGSFPNHHPDPIDPNNLEDLIITVQSQGADIGIALDGDGDRLVAVTSEGEVVWPDRLLMLFAKDVVSRNPGSDVVYDIKCTRHLNSVISGFGGRPIISRSGHSFIKAKMAETDASLGGEMSGHICFKERWFGFDDGLYSAARLLEIVGSQSEGLAELLEEFPASHATPEIQIPVDESQKFALVDKLKDSLDFEEATITTIDGLRVDFSDSWGLVRASNTNACLTLRFEADDTESLENIQSLFRESLTAIDESLTF